jgi:hypothetical protein
MKTLSILVGALVLSVTVIGCARSTVTPVARNQIMINTSAAPACGSDGAVKVAGQLAAIETLRRGYERYMIVGSGIQDNTRMIMTGPTYAQTRGNAYTMGNMAYGSATTRYGGQQMMWTGKHNAQMNVVMFNPDDPGYENAIDAKSILGPEWNKLVADGISTCME